ncbi:MAG TPA: DUF5777 family beta-barrel protein [Chitinophagaceae bacterium]|nr:DUF5777 family beta-barrel protein [Chitinophagaceae bacterium]
MKKILFLLIFWFAYGAVIVKAQETNEPEEKEAPKQKFTRATFNSTKIINMQSTEIVSKGYLQFMISHHFSPIWNKDASTQDNFAQLFGLNSGLAYTYLSFDYSPTDWMNLGVAAAGRSRYEGWAKFKILRQQTGKKNIPVTIGWFSLVNVNAAKDNSVSLTWNKYSFLNQLLISRKFSSKFSLQLTPSLVYFNIVPYGINNSNAVWSLGIGGKYKIADKKNLTFEYSRQLNMYENLIDKNGNIINYKPDLLSLGIEFNTGGHLFQFYIGNTTNSSNIDQLARNNYDISLKNMALGFTINRAMGIKK